MTIFIILSVSGILSMLAGTHKRKSWGLPIVLLACAGAIGSLLLSWTGPFDSVLFDMLIFDKLSISFTLTMTFLTIGILILSHYYYTPPVQHLSDIYSLFMFSLAGAFLLVSAQNLVMVFLGAEILSIPLYILAASNRRSLLSNEAGLKYYLMGSFATCFLLLGVTLMYGAAGTFNLTELQTFLQNGGYESSLFKTGFILLVATLLFKLSAVPFHFWAPDVYEGSPTVLTAFVSTVVKVAVLGAMFRLIQTVFPSGTEVLISTGKTVAFAESPLFWLLVFASGASMIYGSIVALQQSDIKRFLAYTGIFNAGFILIPVLAGDAARLPDLLYYMTGYGIAAILCFTVYTELKRSTDIDSIHGLKGLIHRNPTAGITLIISLLSFTGIPPLAGFWGKTGIIFTGLQGSMYPLLIVAVLTSVIGAFNYSKIIISVISPPDQGLSPVSFHPAFRIWLFLGCLLLVAMGIIPDLFLRMF